MKNHLTQKEVLLPNQFCIQHTTRRAEIYLIDMQLQSLNNYRLIMNYQDNLTKFVVIKPLKTKRAEEIAYYLMELYTTFEVPAILHSDNGR